jgi:hypothetical protein
VDRDGLQVAKTVGYKSNVFQRRSPEYLVSGGGVLGRSQHVWTMAHGTTEDQTVIKDN